MEVLIGDISVGTMIITVIIIGVILVKMERWLLALRMTVEIYILIL